MTPFQQELADAAAAVIQGCCAVQSVQPLEVVADLQLPTLWAARSTPGSPPQVAVNPQRLRYVSAFVREYELAAWVHELLAEASCEAAAVMLQPEESLTE